MKVLCALLDVFACLILAVSIWVFCVSKTSGSTVVYGIGLCAYTLWCRKVVKYYCKRKELNENGFEQSK